MAVASFHVIFGDSNHLGRFFAVHDPLTRSTIRYGALAGLVALVAYVIAEAAPLPARVADVLGFFMGPLLALGFVGVWAALGMHRDTVAARFGCLLGVVAGALVTVSRVGQAANDLLRDLGASVASPAGGPSDGEMIWRSANRMQFSLDVSADVFLALAGLCIGVAMLSNPRFGRGFGTVGMAAAGALLLLHLYTFPLGPASGGLVDVGPVTALWLAAVFIQMLRIDAALPDVADR